MSLSARVNSVSIGRLIIIGTIGAVWLFLIMLIVVGGMAVRSSKAWLPKVLSNATRQPIEKAATTRTAPPVEARSTGEDASEKAARMKGAFG